MPTKKDQYIAEARRIQEAQTLLNREFVALREILAKENPELLEGSSDFAFSFKATSAKHLADYLQYGAHEAARMNR